jgi:hypothetical protein
MSLLATTPPDRLVDAKGRPYFLWDEDLTLDMFRARLADHRPASIAISELRRARV